MVKNLRMLRESRKLSQEKLAALTGLTARRIFSYEQESTEPDIETLASLADFFGVTIDFLVGRTVFGAASESTNSLQLKKFGERVKQYREEKDIERAELAKRVGVTSAYLGLIENGGKIPKLETCIKILNALGMSADAAFMDSLDAAAPQKAGMLQSQIAALPPEKQRFVLNLLESMIQAVQE
ncbi:helix-turn-helix transcriptional regulator [Acutalibacter sp. JLR.KK004]|jgi:transcriptional regulator with XRE-family HTH domain|uniref:helix-turn-helix transcriptional regulator n=1 Tax=Acutalibacter sp. JLR.KK004 TaxID=3112622 RepID=UPI002FF3BFD1